MHYIGGFCKLFARLAENNKGTEFDLFVFQKVNRNLQNKKLAYFTKFFQTMSSIFAHLDKNTKFWENLMKNSKALDERLIEYMIKYE